MTASVAGPAWTRLISTRGVASAPTHSSVDAKPSMGPSEPCSSTNLVMRLVVRLWTAMGMSWCATLRARLAPIVARPVSPKCLSSLIGSTYSARVGSVTPRSPDDPGGE